MTDIQWQIAGLSKEAGFDEVDLNDVEDLLESHAEDLSNENLKDLKQQRALEQQEEAENPTPLPKHFMNKRLVKIFSHIEKVKKIMMEDDLNMERSTNAGRALNNAVHCYRELHERKKREAL